jgi:zinc D-Ala-D-Ala carboxypeptidase
MTEMLNIPDTRSISADAWQEWQCRWPNFQPYELDSRDWSLNINTYALDGLQAIRTEWGRAMRITSAYRSPAHNAAVGGADKSQHLLGTAFDVAVRSSDEGRRLEALARKHGATGIGRYPASKFIHIDWRKGRRATWGRW